TAAPPSAPCGSTGRFWAAENQENGPAMNLYRKLRNIAWRASMKGLERGPHLSRYYMYHRLKAVGRQLPDRTGRVLSISRSSNVCEIMEFTPSEIVQADYPEHNILSLKFPDESFDYVISDQVL